MSGTIVFHHGALGDSVLIWPLLRGLGEVKLVGPWHKCRLAAQWLPNVTPVDGDAADFARLFAPAGQCELSQPVQRLLRDADCIVSFISTGEDDWSHNVRSQTTAPLCCVPARPPIDHTQHLTTFHREQLRTAGIEVTIDPPTARRNLDGPVVLHPGSGSPDKCWPAERFDALIDHLHAMGRAIVVLIGEVERERLDACWPLQWCGRCELIEPPDLIELSRIIARAAIYVGNDSGPTHLAAQLGVPTLALFGPTDARIWQPIGPAVRILAPPMLTDMRWLSTDRVAEAIARF